MEEKKKGEGREEGRRGKRDRERNEEVGWGSERHCKTEGEACLKAGGEVPFV